MNKTSIHKFYIQARERATLKNERYGQACFNLLLEVRPDLAERVRGSEMDPFYLDVTSGQPAWQKFVQFIETSWNYSQDEPIEHKWMPL